MATFSHSMYNGAMTPKEFFKDKKIAIVGLGPHMEMVPDIKYLIRLGALVVLYETRSEMSMRHALAELIDVGLFRYFFGPLAEVASDIAATDLIILSPEISIDASYLKEAQDIRTRIEYPQTLFLKMSPPVTLIGVLGGCGKTTVSSMAYCILRKAFEEGNDPHVYYIDPETPNALSHLKKISKGDIVVARIPTSMIPAYGEARVSPHVAVFTTVDPHEDTIFHILEFQTYNNFIIGSDMVIDEVKEDQHIKPKAKMLRTGANIVPAHWNIPYQGVYDRDNAALALRVAELFKVSMDVCQKALENRVGLKGRLELVKKVGGVEFFNDTASTNPISTLAALRSVGQSKNVVLIFGGAARDSSMKDICDGRYNCNDASEGYDELIDNLSQYVSSVVLLPGSGTMSVRKSLSTIKDLPCHFARSIDDAVSLARDNAHKGDRVLFSPGFNARGLEKTTKERGERFVKAVRAL